MYKGLYVYAWDLADEGLETVLGRIRPTGINTLTLAASYHAGKFLRPHGVGGKVYFPADGTVYFQARPERYGHIRPLVSPMVAEFDAFARLEQQAPDLERVAWVVCCHNTPLGQQHPEFTSRNAFGDPYPYSLCPAHPAVRDYVVNLVADLVDRHDLAGVALETPGWLPYDHGFHHEFALVPLDRFAKSLLALCFADATCSAARAVGIDADRLQARTRELLERYLGADLALSEALATEWWLAEVVSDPEFAAFLHWRCRVVADLVADVKAAVPAPTRLAVIPTVQRPPAAAWLEGSDLALLAGVADALEVPLYQPSAEEAWLSAWDARRRAGDAAALNFILRPSFPDLANGAETVAAVRRLEPLRPAGIAFYNYGHLRLASLDHVTAALAALG
ncbi:MAG: hypothetical protein K0S35_3934 [Geminicoccaceae bacterium]|nr:hypothetical protein [Geminicoccaceae bacterium]